MLSPAERDIVRRDPALPALGRLLDPDAVLETLRPCLPDAEVRSARRTYVRYKPTTNCLAAYVVESAAGSLAVHGRTGGDLDEKLAKSPALSVLRRDASQLFLAFPHDRKLPELALIQCPERRRGLLRGLLPWDLDGARLAVETINYKPDRRWVGRLDVDGRPRAALKLYAPPQLRDARERALLFQESGALRLPPVLGVLGEKGGFVAYEWIDAPPLGERIAAGDPAAVAAAGAALAELHAQRPERLAHHDRDHWISALSASAELSCFLAPRLTKRVSALLGRLLPAVESAPPPECPIHGDFYAKQVLVEGGSAVLLDLDHAAWSHAAADLGLFIAHLKLDVVRERLPEGGVAPIAEALLDGYGAANVDRGLLDLYTSIGLVSLLHHPFRHGDPHWLSRMRGLVVEAERCAPKGEPGVRPRPVRVRAYAPKVPVEDRHGVTRDPRMPYIRDALVPERAEGILRRALRPLGPLHLRSVRVTRHKPGRRCVVEYALEAPLPGGGRERLSVIGKSRARGLDRTTWRVAGALWEAGLRPGGGRGVAIAEPLGIVRPWNMWLQRKVPGTTATHALEGPGGAAVAARIAEALHAFHATPVECTRAHGMADELRILGERLSRLAEERPVLRERLERLLEASAQLAASVPPHATTGIHRDFYPEQVIVDGDAVHIIDLDLYSRGSPALDAGNFCGHLIEHALRATGDPHSAEAARVAFTERFLALSGARLRRALEAYTTLTLARHVQLSTRFEERRPFTERILALCEERLGLAPTPDVRRRAAGAGW